MARKQERALLDLHLALLARLWPASRVILGKRVCKLLNHVLDECEEVLFECKSPQDWVMTRLEHVANDLTRNTEGGKHISIRIQAKDETTSRSLDERFLKAYLGGSLRALPHLASKLAHLALSAPWITDMGTCARDLEKGLWQCESLRTLDLSGTFLRHVATSLIHASTQCSQLTHLSVSNAGMSSEAFHAIADGVSSWNLLQTLDVSSNRIGSDDFGILCAALASRASLQHLAIQDCRITHEGANHLTLLLPTLPQLTSLNPSHNSLSPHGAASLAAGLASSSSLCSLLLSSSDLCSGLSAGFQRLCRALGGCTALTDLDLASNHIGPMSCLCLAECLQTTRWLRRLELSFNPLGRSIRSLAASLRGLASLQHLGLETVGADIGTVEALGAALDGSAVTKLALSSNRLRVVSHDGGCGSLGSESSGNPLALIRRPKSVRDHCLEGLANPDRRNAAPAATTADASNVHLADDCTRLVAQAASISKVSCEVQVGYLARLCGLPVTVLDLRACSLGLRDAEGLGRGLGGHVRELRLCDNVLGDGGVTALSPGLTRATALTSLSLRCNCISPAGAVVLGEAISRLRPLVELELGANKISNSGVTALGERLVHCRGLRRVGLSRNGIGGEGARALATLVTAGPCLVELHGNGCNGDIDAMRALLLARIAREAAC